MLQTSLFVALVTLLPAPGLAGSRAQTASLEPAANPAVDPLENPKRLYRQGQAKYETLDYYGAIELWTQAYAEIPAEPKHARTRALFLYNLARARMRAFELDGDVTHLRQAQGLLERYTISIEGLDEQSDEVREVRTQLDEIIRRLEAHEASSKRDGPAAEGPADSSSDATTTTELTDQSGQPTRRRGLIIAGASTAGVGVGLLGLMGYGLARGAALEKEGEESPPGTPATDLGDVLSDGERANTVALVGGIAGGVLVATGAALVAIELGTRSRRRAELSATFGWGYVALRGRF